MVHLNEIHDKYGEKGLTVLAVSRQDRATVERFIEEFEARYPTVVEKTNSMRAYGRTSVPSAFLINSNGRILWLGHPGNLQDTTIDEAIENTKILPAWPNALKAAKKSFLKDKYAEALSKVAKELGNDRLGEEDTAAAEGIRDWLTWYGESTLEGAKKDSEASHYYEASATYEHLVALYKKHETATKAGAALKELLSDSDRKREVKAGKKLAKILEAIKDLKPKKALKKLKPMLSKRYEETAAGKKAAQIAEQLEQKLEQS